MNYLIIIIISLLSFTINADDKVQFEGEIVVDEVFYKSSFKVLIINESKFSLEVQPSSSSNSCTLDVSHNAAAEGKKGGTMVSNRNASCTYKVADEVKSKFWNSLSRVEISYQVKDDGKLNGTAILRSKEKTYSGKLKFN